jgi:hypothetical protein
MWHNLKARSTAHSFLRIAAGAAVRAIFMDVAALPRLWA